MQNTKLTQSERDPGSKPVTVLLDCASSTCRVSQLAKLGWQKAQSVLLPLHCVRPDGGLIPCTLIVVQRKYPMMVRERLPSGVVIIRTPEAVRAAQSDFDAQAAIVSCTSIHSGPDFCLLYA